MTFTDIRSRRRRTRDDDPEDGGGISEGGGDPEGRSTLSTNYGAPGKENPDDPTSMGHMAASQDAIRAFDARLSAIERRLGLGQQPMRTHDVGGETRAFRDAQAARIREWTATIEKSNKSRWA
jgi:hypothetical protein